VILDTNALSAFAEGEPALAPILHKAIQIAIPVIVLGEYRYGIAYSRDRKHYEGWLAEYLSNAQCTGSTCRALVPPFFIR